MSFVLCYSCGSQLHDAPMSYVLCPMLRVRLICETSLHPASCAIPVPHWQDATVSYVLNHMLFL